MTAITIAALATAINVTIFASDPSKYWFSAGAAVFCFCMTLSCISSEATFQRYRRDK